MRLAIGGAPVLNALPAGTQCKLTRLEHILTEAGSAVVAFSGGVDSSYLLAECRRVMGDRVLAVVSRSESYAHREYLDALEVARTVGAPLREIRTREIEVAAYRSNGPDRCYFCKRELFEQLVGLADREGYRFVFYGAIAEDAADHRPGMEAARQLKVRGPLAEAGLTKPEVRMLSARLGLPTADKPAFACLASRIPHGETVSEEKLRRIEKAEDLLASLGFSQFRVRDHGDVARIEVPPEDIPRLAEPGTRQRVDAGLKSLGYRHVALDLEGYRSGRMNP